MSTEKEMWDEIVSYLEEELNKEPEIVAYTTSRQFVEDFQKALEEEIRNKYGIHE